MGRGSRVQRRLHARRSWTRRVRVMASLRQDTPAALHNAEALPSACARLLCYTHQQPTGLQLGDGTAPHGRRTMGKRIGFGNYQYEVVKHWPKVEIRGAVTVDGHRLCVTPQPLEVSPHRRGPEYGSGTRQPLTSHARTCPHYDWWLTPGKYRHASPPTTHACAGWATGPSPSRRHREC